MKLLVIAVDGAEPSFAALEAFLAQIGIPYEKVFAKNQPIPPLNNSEKGFYQGIILTTGNLALCDDNGCRSALSPEAWNALDTYASGFGVRTLSYYTFPAPRYGLSFVDAIATSEASPGSLTLLPAAAAVFPYLNQDNPIKVANAFTYLATPQTAPGETTTPVLSMSGYTVGAIHTKPDGREYLSLTMDNSPFLFHSMALNYGLLNWVTKGVFLGARKIYLSPQVDDLFLSNFLSDLRDPACISLGAATDPILDPARQCSRLRITGDDLEALAAWQDRVNERTQTRRFKVSIAFNGSGAMTAAGRPLDDTLVSSARSNRFRFFWTSHTYDHKNLDCFAVANRDCLPADYAQSSAEIGQNVDAASALMLPLDAKSVITPGMGGLRNPEFLQAAADQGIQYFATDASRPEGSPPSPNTGIVNPAYPSLLMIPRRATDIFVSASTPTIGVPGSEPDQYNYLYGPDGVFRIGGPGGPPFFTVEQTYSQIIERESNKLLTYMLRYEPYPIMFHQSNLWRYSGNRSLFSDTIDAVLAAFGRISSLPVESISQSAIGELLRNRMSYNASGVKATLNPGASITLTTVNDAIIPVTTVRLNLRHRA